MYNGGNVRAIPNETDESFLLPGMIGPGLLPTTAKVATRL
jgi:hypothetical protein